MILICDRTLHSVIRRQYGTNQNFILRPSSSDVYPTGFKLKPLPKSLNKLIAPTKLKDIYKGRYLSEHRELTIDVVGGIGDQILIERVLSVPNN